jgi:hypothetical protein
MRVIAALKLLLPEIDSVLACLPRNLAVLCLHHLGLLIVALHFLHASLLTARLFEESVIALEKIITLTLISLVE